MSLLLWLAPVLVPLVAAVVVAVRPGPRTSWTLLAAPLPALLLALVGPVVDPPLLPWLLLDVQVMLDDVGQLLLALTAIVWTAAGVYGRRQAETATGYGTWWLLSLTGNVGVVLAGDVLSFYTAFVVMTLAAYGLVVHTRTPASRRAGRVYLVLGVVGETVLLAGLLLAAVEASGLRFAEIAEAVAVSPRRDLIVALLVVGFGIKAGVFGLHVWLPLAHPAAPFAASAVLSGSMIKAGLVGWLRLLPIGEAALPGWSALLVGLGLATAFLGVVLGLTQTAPKVVLAYSSVSQMGFVTVLVGTALLTTEAAAVAVAAAAVYAFHHGLAKAVLFLAAGLLAATPRGRRRTVLLAGSAVAGLSLAGAPLLSGSFAKAWMKQGLDRALVDPNVATAASVAAAGTLLLMGRLLLLLRAQAAPDTGAPGTRLLPWGALIGGMLVLTPVAAATLLPVLETPSRTAFVVDATWPVLLGLALFGAGAALGRRARLPRVAVPAGDVVVVGERAALATGRLLGRVARPTTAVLTRTSTAVQDAAAALGRHDEGLDRLEDRLTRWRTGGAMIATIAVVLVVTLGVTTV